MMTIRKSVNADSRTSKENSTIQDLEKDTKSHISDVSKGLDYMADMIKARGPIHDHTKLEMLDEFFAALKSGHIKDTEWYKKHITQERHHPLSYVHQDINLIDIVEYVVDCTMAGLARSGTVYDLDIDPAILLLAAQNTSKLIIENTKVIESSEYEDIMDSAVED